MGGPGYATAFGLWAGAPDEIVVGAIFDVRIDLRPFALESALAHSPDIAVFGLARRTD